MTSVTYGGGLEVTGEEEGVTDKEAGIELCHINSFKSANVPEFPGAGVNLRHIGTIECSNVSD